MFGNRELGAGSAGCCGASQHPSPSADGAGKRVSRVHTRVQGPTSTAACHKIQMEAYGRMYREVIPTRLAGHTSTCGRWTPNTGTTEVGSGASTGTELEGVVGTRGPDHPASGQGQVRAEGRSRTSCTPRRAPSAAPWTGSGQDRETKASEEAPTCIRAAGDGGPARGRDHAGAEERKPPTRRGRGKGGRPRKAMVDLGRKQDLCLGPTKFEMEW